MVVQKREKQEKLVKGSGFQKSRILNPDFPLFETSRKNDLAMPGNRTTCPPAMGLTSPGLQLLGGLAVATPLFLANHPTHVVLHLGFTRSIGSRAAIERFQKHAWYYGITTEFCRCNKSFVFANSETETCMESCIIHFQQHHHVLPKLMCLRQVTCHVVMWV